MFTPLLGRTTVSRPADFQSALSWDRAIPGGTSASVSLRKTLTVPEPRSDLLAATAAVLLFLGAWRGAPASRCVR